MPILKEYETYLVGGYLRDLFLNAKIDGNNKLSIEDIAFLIARGGWPLSINQDKQISLKEVKTKIPVTIIEEEDYVDQIIISDNLEPYKLPGEMFKTIKERFILEKVPRK